MAQSYLRLADKVSSLLEDCTNKVRALAALPCDGTAMEGEFPERLGRALQTMASADARFLSGGSHDAIVVREATKQLLSALDYESTAALVGISSRVALREGGGLFQFIDTMIEFRNIARERLATGMDVLRATDERASKMQAKIANAESELRAKRELLRLRREERTLEATAVTEQIARLRAEIDEVSTKGRANEAALSAFSSQQESAQRGAHSSKVAELRAEYATLVTEFNKAVEANETAASTLRKRRNHVRSEYARVIAEYDRDMLEVTEKTAKIKELIAREKAQLDILRPHFALVDMNNRAAAEEAEVVRKRKEAEEAAREAKFGPPARRIQRWFKRVLHNRAAEKKAKKGKGKGKGKK